MNPCGFIAAMNTKRTSFGRLRRACPPLLFVVIGLSCYLLPKLLRENFCSSQRSYGFGHFPQSEIVAITDESAQKTSLPELQSRLPAKLVPTSKTPWENSEKAKLPARLVPG